MSSDNMGIGGHLRAIGNIMATGAEKAGKQLLNEIEKSLPERASVEKFMGLKTVEEEHKWERKFQLARSGVERMSDKQAIRQMGRDFATITSSIFKNTWQAIKEDAKTWKEMKKDVQDTGKAIKGAAESVIEKGKGLVKGKKPEPPIRGSFRM
ncbi:MAG: hypothetical protein LLG04_03390 [Parachlamydia sp.]|nr:hypothetical protein [Parachlamydia sp.]